MDIENLLSQILNAISGIQSDLNALTKDFGKIQERTGKSEEAISNIKSNIIELKNTAQKHQDEMKCVIKLKQDVALLQNVVDTVKQNLSTYNSRSWDLIKIILQHLIWALVYGGVAYLLIKFGGGLP